MRKAQFFYLLRRGLLSGGLNFIKEGLVMASKFTTQGLSFPSTGSAEFNGTSDYIQLDNAFSHTNHTIAAWVSIDSFTSWSAVFAAQSSSSDGIRLAVTSDNRIYYRVNNGAIYPSTPTISADTWFHLAANYDGSVLKVYIDGSLIATSSYTTAVDNETNATIGSRSDAYGDKLTGNLANVAIWNRALSSDEINSVMWKSYEALSGAESNGLQAWYSLDDITSPAASLANMEQLATDKNATIENKAAITAAINALS